jgi:ATP-dependent helicase/nuclease subunit A
MKKANIQMFYQLASDYERQSLKDLPQFLDYLSSLDNWGLVVSGNQHPSAVTIMSIHKSKGLEFPVVFLCNLSRRFNMENLRSQILCDKTLGLGMSVADTEKRIRYPSAAKRAISVKMAAESISEEMRVLYVAMTRARDRLIMTYASQTLESDLQDIVLRQDFDGGELVCREATCIGDWVLLAALQRMEAGALHGLASRPKALKISDYPWHIAISQTGKPEKAISAGSVERKTDAALSLCRDRIQRYGRICRDQKVL